MSFSKRFTGTAIAVLAALAAFPAEQRETDVKGGCAEDGGVTIGHEKQINAAIAEVTPALEGAAKALPETQEFVVNIHGHANQDQTGGYNWSMWPAADRPTPHQAE